MSEPQQEISATGSVLRNRYDVGEVCGRGGMAQVYRGFDRLLARPIAIKLLIHLNDMAMIQRFEREAQILSQLNHPNIAAIYDFGIEGDQPFMIMELVEGKSLDQFLSDDRAMHTDQAIPLILQIGEGLATAHENGVVHRDIKPENILVCSGEKQSVRLIDFGLAVSDGQIKSNDRLTMHGFCVGTQRYMSPEQMDGKTPTPATDIYAFGLVCAELLAGSRAVLGGRLLLHEAPAYVEKFWPVIEKACRENPADRWSSVRDMISALRKRAEATRLQKRFFQTRIACTKLARSVVGRGKQEKILAAASAMLGCFIFFSWGLGIPLGGAPNITLDKVGISWLPKNQIRVRVMGMAERANPMQLFIETSIYDSQGELMADPSSTIIDKVLHSVDALKISNSLQSLDKDFRFKMPSRQTTGFVHVRIFDQKRTLVTQQRIPLAPPQKNA
jgi:hypothetical protein